MTKDREIVLMLIRRKRFAYNNWRKMRDWMAAEVIEGQTHPQKWFLDALYAQATEAANAAECARRILYNIPL